MYFPQYFVGTSDTLFQKHLISGVNILHTYIHVGYNQCSFLLLLTVWCNINDSIYTDKTLTLSKFMCMRASELRTFWYFYILKLLFLSIFCRYKWHACRLTCSDTFPNVPTNFQMYRQKSEKALLGANCPPAPPGYANDGHTCIGLHTYFYVENYWNWHNYSHYDLSGKLTRRFNRQCQHDWSFCRHVWNFMI